MRIQHLETTNAEAESEIVSLRADLQRLTQQLITIPSNETAVTEEETQTAVAE